MGVVILLRLEGSTEVPGWVSFLDLGQLQYLDRGGEGGGWWWWGVSEAYSCYSGEGFESKPSFLERRCLESRRATRVRRGSGGSGNRAEAALPGALAAIGRKTVGTHTLTIGSSGPVCTSVGGQESCLSLGTSTANIQRFASSSRTTQNWQLTALIRRRDASPQLKYRNSTVMVQAWQ